MSADPSGADFKRLLADDDGRPVVMLNLLRFTESGRAIYAEYLRQAAPYLDAAGAEVLHHGDLSTALVAHEGFAWDAVVVVKYPSRTAFCEMVRNPGYQEAARLRTAALTAAVLQASSVA